MKKIQETDKGYYYAEVSLRECINWGGLGLCDTCNTPIVDGGYLIWVLNSCLCDQCFNAWLNRSKRYEEDLQLQYDNSEYWFENYFGKNCVAMPDSYNNYHIERLNNKNKEGLSRLSDLDKSIEDELKKLEDIFGKED